MVDSIIPIDITGGMDDDSSLKQTIGHELLENIIMNDTGYPRKRNGFDLRALNENDTNPTPRTIGAAKILISEGNRDAIIFENKFGIYNHANLQTDISVQPKSYLGIEYSPLLTSVDRVNLDKADFSRMTVDSIFYDNKYYIIYWDNALNEQVIDPKSGQFLIFEDDNSLGGNKPRLVLGLNDVFYAYTDEDKLFVRSMVNTGNSYEGNYTGYVSANAKNFDKLQKNIDICVDSGGNVYVSYFRVMEIPGLEIETRILKLDSSLNFLSDVIVETFFDGGISARAILDYAPIATDNSFIYIWITGNKSKVYKYDLTLALDNSKDEGAESILVNDAKLSVIGGQLFFMSSSSTNSVAPFNSVVRYGFLDVALPLVPAITKYSFNNHIALSGFTEFQDKIYFVAAYVENEAFATYLVELSKDTYEFFLGALINIGDQPNSYQNNNSNTILNLQVVGDELYFPYSYYKDNYKPTISGEIASNVSQLIKFSEGFTSKSTYNKQIVSCLNYPYSIISRIVSPLFFAHPPIIYQVATNAGAPAANIFYYAVYEFFDAYGNVYRSSLSLIKNVANEVSAANPATIDVTAYSFRDRNTSIALYRTKTSNPNQFYFVKRVKSPLPLFTPLASIVDDINDASLGGELYTAQLGENVELENTPPYPMSFIVNHNNRIYGINSQDDRKVVYSKQPIEGRGLEWNDTLNFIVENDKEGQESGLVALGSTENYLVIFKKSSIFAISGDGPNNIGLGETHTLPMLVSDTIGCIEPSSVVNVTLGIIFKSYNGFYIITKGLQLVYIGKGAGKRENDKILSSVIHRKRNVVMWLTEAGEIICLDLSDSQNPIKWTVLSGFTDAVFMSYANQQLRVLKSNGDMLVENEVFSDNGSFIQQTITTGWLRVGDIAEYQRVKRLFITGEYKSDHTLKVDVSYDFEDYVYETHALTPVTNYEVNTAPPVLQINTGTNTGVYEWDIHLQRQKCSAVKFTIYDEERNGIIGESFQLEGLALKVGKKVGLRKINQTKKG